MKIHYPRSREELVELLEKGKGRVAPVGGGMSFSFSIPAKVTELACMREIGLDGIALDGEGLRVGARVTLTQLMNSGEARGFRNGLLATVASKIAATPNRNMITVGGNAVRVFIWSDLPAVYCAAGASFTVRGANGVRIIPATEFYAKQPASVLHHSEYLEEIIVPPAPPRAGEGYEKFCETANTFALASATACVSLDGSGNCETARLSFGNLRVLPRVSPEAEDILRGRKPGPEAIGKAASAAAAAAEIVKDIRASMEYKRELSTILAVRVLERAFSLAGAGE